MFEVGSLLTMFDTIQIRIFTWRKGVLVGTDAGGNRYYKSRKVQPGRKERRWVVYNGAFEPSKVPPEWFGWLHYTTNEILPANSRFHKPWIKPHQPNMSGTAAAYRQPGHALAGGVRPQVSADYEPWQPV